LTTYRAGVLISCNYSKQERDLLDNDKLEELSFIGPDTMCTSWQGKEVGEDYHDGGIGTNGSVWSFSTDSKDEARIVYEDHGFVLKNVRTGEDLPAIYISMLDAFAYRPTPTTPYSFIVVVSSPEGYFPGEVSVIVSGGNGTLSDITTLKSSGNYTLNFHPTGVALSSGTLQIRIIDCQLGEELTKGGLCQECDALSFNFLPKIRNCTSCPNNANCQGRYIVPEDGYWHQSPCHARVMRCLNEEACQVEQRQNRLQNITQEFSDCSMNNSVPMLYHETLCREVLPLEL